MYQCNSNIRSTITQRQQLPQIYDFEGIRVEFMSKKLQKEQHGEEQDNAHICQKPSRFTTSSGQIP